jgi:hypothetical protein
MDCVTAINEPAVSQKCSLDILEKAGTGAEDDHVARHASRLSSTIGHGAG